MTILDETIVNVALPVMREELGFSQGGVSWVINAYLIAYGGLLIFAGRLGDLIGHKNVLLLGVSLPSRSRPWRRASRRTRRPWSPPGSGRAPVPRWSRR
ncbi:MFS transporter [Streptomyces sp. S1A(2023)]